MRCHYEVLDVEQTADLSEIKRNYRKLALQNHPDKNPDRIEECTKIFHEVQAAYDVLSDPQERAWYDKHREAILFGGDDYVDDSVDLMHYFNPGVYCGFGDDEDGFYSVFRNLFRKISEEDERFVKDDESDYDPPEFGTSGSSFEEVVKPFYNFWLGYFTKKSYVWIEKYDTRLAPNRPTQRLMEKENKKAREAHKKKRNEEVRALVAFIRKRDKRVQAYRKDLERKQKEQQEKNKERQAELKREKLEKMKGYQEQDWMAFDNMTNQLNDIESHFDKQFGRRNGEVDSSDEDLDHFYCIACDKTFKSDKALANHEKSKKHKENVEMIKNEMEDDELLKDLHIEEEVDLDQLLREDEDDKNEDDNGLCPAKEYQRISSLNLPEHVIKKNVIETVEGENSDQDLNEEAEVFVEEVSEVKSKKKKKKKSKNQPVIHIEECDDRSTLQPKDSLALPRKSSKAKKLKAQAEKRRSIDSNSPDNSGGLDAALGESSIADSIMVNKKRATKAQRKKARQKLLDDVKEFRDSDSDSAEGVEEVSSSEEVSALPSDNSDVSEVTPKEESEDINSQSTLSVDVKNIDSESAELTDRTTTIPLTDSCNVDSVDLDDRQDTPVGDTETFEDTLAEFKANSRTEKSGKSKSKKPNTKSDTNDMNSVYRCGVCGKDYPSKNKLFGHIKSEGHAQLKESSGKTKGKKGKNKK